MEQPSVSQPFQRLKQDGWDVTVLPVDAFGRVDPESVEAALRPDTVRVSLMHANSEIGAIQPIAEIANFTRPRGILLHTENKRRAPWCPPGGRFRDADRGRKPRSIGIIDWKRGRIFYLFHRKVRTDVM